MDTPTAIGVVAAAFADRGQLTADRELELGAAFSGLLGSVVTSLERIAAAQEAANMLAMIQLPDSCENNLFHDQVCDRVAAPFLVPDADQSKVG